MGVGGWVQEGVAEEQGELPSSAEPRQQQHPHDDDTRLSARRAGAMGRCAQRHSCWVASAALGMLSPHLAEKVGAGMHTDTSSHRHDLLVTSVLAWGLLVSKQVRELFTDLTCAETEASETAAQAQARTPSTPD